MPCYEYSLTGSPHLTFSLRYVQIRISLCQTLTKFLILHVYLRVARERLVLKFIDKEVDCNLYSSSRNVLGMSEHHVYEVAELEAEMQGFVSQEI